MVKPQSNEMTRWGPYSVTIVSAEEFATFAEAQRCLGMRRGWVNILASCGGGLVRAALRPDPRGEEVGVTAESLQRAAATWLTASWADRVGLKLELLVAVSVGFPRTVWNSLGTG